MFNILTNDKSRHGHHRNASMANTGQKLLASARNKSSKKEPPSMQQQIALNNIADNALGLFDQLYAKKQKKKLTQAPKINSLSHIEVSGVDETSAGAIK